MPVDLAADISRRGKSAAYVSEAVREKLSRYKRTEIEAGLQCLAHDDQANDSSDFAAPQARVMARADSAGFLAVQTFRVSNRLASRVGTLFAK